MLKQCGEIRYKFLKLVSSDGGAESWGKFGVVKEISSQD